MSDPSTTDSVLRPRVQIVGIILGPAAATLICLSPAPSGLSQEGWWTAAVAVWMALWWMTEALPLAITALLPLIVFPVLNLRGMEQTAASFANPLIFLFLGGFLLARAMQVWRLDHRVAISVLRVAGSDPAAIIAALMVVTAFLSMWVSNTAASMVMLPIALSVTRGLSHHRDMAPALLLGVAYSATIGGMGTIVGTPPNALFVAFMSESYGIDVSFARWMLIAMPLVLILLPITWFVLTHLRFPIAEIASMPGESVPNKENTVATPLSREQKLVGSLMLLVATGWVTRPFIEVAVPWLQLSDAGIALTGALILFLFPVDLKRGRFLLSWNEAAAIRWDVLILFGGGLALAAAIAETDLATWIGSRLSGLSVLPTLVLLLSLGAVLVLVGELASNTAMAAVFLPVAGATALGMGHAAHELALPVALFATLGFMLPVATPPNAIVFGSANLEARHMLKAGAIIDVAGIVVVSVAVTVLGKWALG